MQYHRLFIFSKHTDLLPYFYTKYNNIDLDSMLYDKLKSRYAPKRDVRLLLLARYNGNKMICRIKCPINPMPVRGEFEVSSVYDIFAFLVNMGWEHQETINLNMLT